MNANRSILSGKNCESDLLTGGGPTRLTESTEISDPDSIFMSDPTYLTHAVEPSDPDEFNACGPTNMTFTKEDTDVDEFYPNELQTQHLIKCRN